MLSTAKSIPASQRRIPKARYHRTNEALRSGAKLASRCDPQISAARWGEAATKAPSAIAIVLTNRFVVITANPFKSATRTTYIASSWGYRGGSTIRPQAPERGRRYPHSD